MNRSTFKNLTASMMEEKEHNLHKNRLWKIKSSIDNRPPYKPKFLKKRMKKKKNIGNSHQKKALKQPGKLLLIKISEKAVDSRNT